MKNENINEILSAREEKHQQIFNLLNDYKTVVVLSINYPGPNKCNDYSKEVFISAIDKIKKEFQVDKIIQKESLSRTPGFPENYLDRLFLLTIFFTIC